jgi:DNA primase
LPLSRYLLRELTAQVDLRTQEGRSALLQRAKPLLAAITAPATALLLRKEVAALAGITQAELEALYAIKPIGAPPRRAPQKTSRPAASSMRVLLRCLLYQPDLAGELPPDWLTDAPAGAEAEAISALAGWLRENDGGVSTAAMIQHFQGAAHAALLAAEQAEIMQWGEEFDVAAEFQGVLSKLRDEERKQQLQALHAKMHGRGMNALDEEERALYKQLLQRG